MSCFLTIACAINIAVTSWGELVVWEERAWIHPQSCKKSWGHWNTSKQSLSLFYTPSTPLAWFLSLNRCIPALLNHLHPVHASYRTLHRKHMEDLCFLNITQDYLLSVSKTECQNWREDILHHDSIKHMTKKSKRCTQSLLTFAIWSPGNRCDLLASILTGW